MEFHTHRKIQGFTLIELMVVLTIGVALTGIAVKSASDLAFVARYEQTSEMADRIKSAIIGRPGRYINGQPDISGYVADIGRTPEYLRDLLQAGYCKTSTDVYVEHKSEASCEAINITHSWDWADTPCLKKSDTTNTTVTNEVSCTPTADYVWIGVGFDTDTNLKYGWNGPYLQTSKQANNNSALEDGWGNGTEEKNYGWRVNNASSIGVGDTFSTKSKGKDQVINTDGCLNYEDDCSYEIQGNGYTKTISSITVLINSDDNKNYTSSDTGSCNNCSTLGECSVSSYLTKFDCISASEAWTPFNTLALCTSPKSWDLSSHANKQLCLDNGGAWTSNIVNTPVASQQELCAKIYYRDNGQSPANFTNTVAGSPPSIDRDGTVQPVTFEFDTAGTVTSPPTTPKIFPNGVNAIRIYTANVCEDTSSSYALDDTITDETTCTATADRAWATCSSHNTYPASHAIQHITFVPYKTIDNLAW